MIKINDVYFVQDYFEIFLQLKEYLNIRGINYFKHYKKLNNDIMVTCPFHKDGNESKPSCGISLIDGMCHCFTCGTVKTFTQLISFVLGFNDNGEKGFQWLLENIGQQQASVRESVYINERVNKSNNYVSEQELDSYRYYHQYMFDRKLTKEIIEKFDVGFDKNTNCITFPVRDKNGNTLFIARRSIQSKFFNYPEGVKKPLYGLYEMSNNCKSIIICESIFNCLTCYVYGKEALALNGTGNNEQLNDLLKLNARTIYLALDNDEAGNNGANKIYQKIKNKFIVKRMIFPLGKDVNDLTKEEFDYIYNNAVLWR